MTRSTPELASNGILRATSYAVLGLWSIFNVYSLYAGYYLSDIFFAARAVYRSAVIFGNARTRSWDLSHASGRLTDWTPQPPSSKCRYLGWIAAEKPLVVTFYAAVQLGGKKRSTPRFSAAIDQGILWKVSFFRKERKEFITGNKNCIRGRIHIKMSTNFENSNGNTQFFYIKMFINFKIPQIQKQFI